MSCTKHDMRPGRPGLFYCLLALLVAALTAAVHAQEPQTTMVSDIVYRADGTAAQGSLVISWPAFTTADGKAVAAGNMGLTLGEGGTVALALAPNEGATPGGTYYRVVLRLDEAVASRDIADEKKFREGLGKIIDGIVDCLNASAWAKAR